MIEILQAEFLEDFETGAYWACWLAITQASESWMLPATAPGTLAEGDLQAHFEAQEATLWPLAQAKGYVVDLYERIPPRRLQKAIALLLFDEINILRAAAGLPERTAEQVVNAIKAKLRQ